MPLSLYLLALAVFAMGTSEFMLAGLLPEIAAGLDVSVGSAGLLTSAFAVGMIIGAPLMALAVRRLPTRASLLIFVSVFAAVHVIGALTASFAMLLITRLAAALANAGFLAVALGAAVSLVTADRRARALAVLLSGTTVATVAGVPGGALLGTLFDWRATFWVIALLCVPAAAGIARSLPSERSRVGPAAGQPVSATSPRSELGQLGAARLLLAMLLGALINGATFAGYTFLAPIVTQTAGLSRSWVPGALVLFGIGSSVGVAVAGRLADRHGDAVIITTTPLLMLGWLAMTVLAGHAAALLILVLIQGALSDWAAR
ncbi:MFS transporter, DHA1 family, chloramphenicol resistance protein [Microlunatus soli]|uniref:MFS transporter, DHA1 family, chloramphenicol resistance protein n=1 Tax=Microlunatus soli TaxID=630515 RepID=A0A1H1X8J6_9ACTN|nr:MFS transporter [Microlunatus soli]SDT05381.1 MFS transporter, DHA1 family, chloramphenicol resistance protein [Microlunatus soli]